MRKWVCGDAQYKRSEWNGEENAKVTNGIFGDNQAWDCGGRNRNFRKVVSSVCLCTLQCCWRTPRKSFRLMFTRRRRSVWHSQLGPFISLFASSSSSYYFLSLLCIGLYANFGPWRVLLLGRFGGLKIRNYIVCINNIA